MAFSVGDGDADSDTVRCVSSVLSEAEMATCPTALLVFAAPAFISSEPFEIEAELNDIASLFTPLDKDS
ncbi:hypothetical protein IW150_001440 [Coemansia sp. RSA 2607]|nr:hypothetical protein IW150_001440 [Coemansia sp. RSA 2607]